MVHTIAGGLSRHAPVRMLARMFRRNPLIGVAFGAVAVTLTYALLDAPASTAARTLEVEFAQLRVPPAAQLVSRYSTHKPGQAVVGAEYRAVIAFDALRFFYDDELDAHGWQHVSDSTLTDWGRDLGGNIACYRKADYWATLQSLGDLGRQGYVIDLVWGSSLCARAG